MLTPIVLFFFPFVLGCPDWDVELEKRSDLYSLGHANNYLAVSLHRELSRQDDGNVFFSPFSVSSALAMLYVGARGETAAELRKVLGYGRLNDSAIFSAFHYYLTEVVERIDPKIYAMNSVSAMVIEKSFPVLQMYKNDVRSVFQAYVQEADIAQESAAVVDRMNTWSKIKTRGAIDVLANNIDPDTMLFLANAAYFKGSWKVSFDPKDTKYHPFYNGGQRTDAIQILMMHSHSTFRYYDGEGEDFTAVELFYKGRNMSMVIYLPDEDDGLRDVERSMTAAKMSYVRRQMYYTKVHLTMPKLKLTYHRSLSRALQGLGVQKIFRVTDADLSGMTSEGASLALNDVEHKAVIEVNEQGSAASAFTKAIITKSLPMLLPDPEFHANHPFLFAIFDSRSGMILFMGRVTKFAD